MKGVLVVASHLDGETPFTSTRYPTATIRCVTDFDYWDGLTAAWDTPVLVNIERDMEVTDDLITQLVDCPHPLCAYPYLVCPGATPVYAHRADGLIGTPDIEWADWAAPGFCKISAPGRAGRLLPRHPWWGVEESINASIKTRWHLHWPAIAHFHEY